MKLKFQKLGRRNMDRTTKTRRTIESGRLQGKEIEIK